MTAHRRAVSERLGKGVSSPVTSWKGQEAGDGSKQCTAFDFLDSL
jgi:hypothetical protein